MNTIPYKSSPEILQPRSSLPLSPPDWQGKYCNSASRTRAPKLDRERQELSRLLAAAKIIDPKSKGPRPGIITRPIALQARPSPPVVPHATSVGIPPGMVSSTPPGSNKNLAEVTLLNVYNNRHPFPKDTVITAV